MTRRWYESVWPDASGDFVLVNVLNAPREDLIEAVQAYSGVDEKARYIEPPSKIFLFYGHPLTARRRFLHHWNPLDGQSTPPNVWLGLPVNSSTEVEDVIALLRSPAQRRFVEVSEEPSEPVLEMIFQPWRCTRCGKRGFGSPKTCCEIDSIEPLISWLVADDPSPFAEIETLFGVTLWPPNRPPMKP